MLNKEKLFSRKRMYKSGKNWVVASALFATTLFFSSPINANAADPVTKQDPVTVDKDNNTQASLNAQDQTTVDKSKDDQTKTADTNTTNVTNNVQNSNSTTTTNSGQDQNKDSQTTNNDKDNSNQDPANNSAVITATNVENDDSFVNITGGTYKLQNGVWVYIDINGKMLTGLHTIDGDLQYFDQKTGAQAKGIFETVSGITYYFDKNTGNSINYAENQAGKIEGFDDKGQPLKNAFASDSNGTTYYFDANGQTVPYALSINNQIKGFDSQGQALKNGFANDISGNTYYFGAEGQVVVGLQKINGQTYYFDQQGHQRKNYATSISGQWYYFDSNTGAGKNSLQYQFELGLTSQNDSFTPHNAAKSYDENSFQNVDDYLTAETWYRPVDILKNGTTWTSSTNEDFRPLLMTWWPDKQTQADYLNFMQKQGLIKNTDKFSSSDSQLVLNKAAENVQVAIEEKISQQKDTDWLKSVLAVFVKQEANWNSSTEDVNYSGLQFQGGFLSYQNSDLTPNANSDWRLLNRALFDRNGENSYSGSDFLLANDIDNSNPIVQAEELNWLYYLMNFGSITTNDSDANFDGIRVDAVDNIDTDLLQIAADYFKEAYGVDKNDYLADQHLSILEDWSGADVDPLKTMGNPQLTMDNSLHNSLISALTGKPGSRWSLDSLISNALVNRQSDSSESGENPNYSFVRAHDSEVQSIIGQILTDKVGANSGNDFTWDQLSQALQFYYADQASTEKEYTQYNVPSAYSLLLTNKDTVPRVYYGDLFTDGGQYMATKSIYYDGIDALLKARTKYVAGGQSMSMDGNGVLTSVRFGDSAMTSADQGTSETRTEGLGVIVSNDPNLNINSGTVVLHMGAAHKNQAYRALILTTSNGIQTYLSDDNSPVVYTNENGDLIFTNQNINGQQYTLIKGYANAQVSGYLAVWVPVGAPADQNSTTVASNEESSDNSIFHSNAALDSNVIYEGFSNFQSMPTNKDEYTNAVIAKNADLFKSWGITSFEMAPQYRSSEDGTFLDSTVNNGYAFTDRYDLGFNTPTKYGTTDDLTSAIKSLHAQGIQVIADWVPDQIYNLPGQEAVTATRVDQNGDPMSGSQFKDLLYVANTIGGGDYQAKYGGAFLSELESKYPNLFTRKQESTGTTIDPSTKITSWEAKYFNGTNILGRGAYFVLKDWGSNKYFKIGQTSDVFLPLQLMNKTSQTGFVSDEKGIKYYSLSGYQAKNTFIEDGNGNWYYFDENGYMKQGSQDGMSALTTIPINGSTQDATYLILPNSVEMRNGFAQDVDGYTYYFDEVGQMVKDKYVFDGAGNVYHLGTDGKMSRGLNTMGQNLQYFSENGVQLKNADAYDQATGQWYAFDDGTGNGHKISGRDNVNYVTFDSTIKFNNAYAQIIDSNSNLYDAYIVQRDRNDGIYLNGPALSSDKTMSSDEQGQKFNGDKVTVLQTSITQRANGLIYTYVKVYDQKTKENFWIDVRALNTKDGSSSQQYATMYNRDLNSYQAIIKQNNRKDGIYNNGPALTNPLTLLSDGKADNFNGDIVTVLETITTKRGSTEYTYTKVQDGSKTFWVDKRTIDPLAQVINVENASNQYAIIDGNTRNDGIYLNGPALTNSQTIKADNMSSSALYKGNVVQVLEIDTTERSNGNKYQYAKVQDGTAIYWIDVRSLDIEKYANFNYQNVSSYQAFVDQTSRTDGIYLNGPALTSTDTLKADGQAANYQSDIVTVDKIAVTKRANGKTYTYVYVHDGSHNYWIDERAIHRLDQIISTQSMITNGNQYAIIDGTTRDDGIYLNGPAMTSIMTWNADYKNSKYNNHIVQILQITKTQRPNGNTYSYAQVQDGDITYWLDVRSLVYSTISSHDWNGYTATINETNRKDGIYLNGPAYTSKNTFYSDDQANKYNGHTVTVLQTAVTQRSNGISYKYAEVQDGSKTYWIDVRALKKQY